MATATDTKAKDRALRNVEKRAAQLTKRRSEARTARDALDKEILAARTAGATYRELASTVGVSTAWIQAALERAGYQTKAR